jgi:class 3 adenylate cyclase
LIKNYFQGALILLRRLPPLSVPSNEPLFLFLIQKESNNASNNFSVFASVFQNSQDSIFCLNKNETIEMVNPSVFILFGFTPEQLLGQHLSYVLPSERCKDIYNQMSLMRKGQCALLFDQYVEALTDIETCIPVQAILLGFTENSSTEASSFVVILRDESQLQNQMKEAQEAKVRSEELLYSILPRDIVIRINQGEKDICFSVPSASIIFIDIVKFSEYSSGLTPSQIMETLSLIYSKFDSIAERFEMITKIKLIGDDYMAAAGLFHPDEEANKHASQIVQFGLECIQAIEEVNVQLNSQLHVRVGVNTDGPLIAGVLGTDKPIFDIIGDPINVAARLQSTGIPGSIQISQTTYDLIQGMDFDIEYRGKIVLKGKGKRKTYLVREVQNINPSFGITNDNLK